MHTQCVRQIRGLKRIALSTIALLLSVLVSGCWYAALELAPIGARVAESVGSGAVELAAGTTAAAHQHKAIGEEEDQDQKTGMCDELLLKTPSIIELRSNTAGSLEWRELELGGSDDAPQWTVAVEEKGGESTWSHATNLAKMDFQPPVQGLIMPGESNYLAYAPTQLQDSSENGELIALVVDFGPTVGTFSWDGRIYQYAVVHKLPCFPTPQ